MMIIKIIINSDVIIIVAGFNSAYFTLFNLYILLYILLNPATIIITSELIIIFIIIITL